MAEDIYFCEFGRAFHSRTCSTVILKKGWETLLLVDDQSVRFPDVAAGVVVVDVVYLNNDLMFQSGPLHN